MTGPRTRAFRSEIVATLFVVLAVAGAVFLLWPGSNDRPGTGTPTAAAPPVAEAAVPEAELAPLRAAARLQPCPSPTTDRAPAGPLNGLVLDCLGAPGRVALGPALAGRPVLVNLWASWCGPCRAELPALAAYAARPGAVAVLGIDVRDDPRPALRMLTDLDVHLPSVSDPGNAVRAALGAPPAVPLSFLVRADGTVAMVDPPIPFAGADDVAAAIARLT